MQPSLCATDTLTEKRFLFWYHQDPLFGLAANAALIFSGQYVRWVSKMRSTLAPGVDAWAVSLRYLMGAVLVSGGVLVAAYKHMQDNIVSKMAGAAERKDYPRKKKARMTMKESAKFLMSSPYIRDLAMLVISYGMCINIVEVSWKSKLKVCAILPVVLKVVKRTISSILTTIHFPLPHHSKRSPTRMSIRLSWGTFHRLRVQSPC